eukprot:403348160
MKIISAIQIFFLVLVVSVVSIILNDKQSFIAQRLRQLLGVRTLSEYLVDFEVGREMDLPMEITVLDGNNITNKAFYVDFMGGFYPVILKHYLRNITGDQTYDKLQQILTEQDTQQKTGQFLTQQDYLNMDKELSSQIFQQIKPLIMEKNMRPMRDENNNNMHEIIRIFSGQRTRSFYQRHEQLMCGLQGNTEMKLLTAMQSILIQDQVKHEDLPPNESEFDMFDIDKERYPDSNMAFIYPVLLQEGDCLYIPPYWWQQIESDPNKPSIAVSYWYEVSSDWLKLVFTGIEKGYI